MCLPQSDLSHAVHADHSRHLLEALQAVLGTVGKRIFVRFRSARGKVPGALSWATGQGFRCEDIVDAELWRDRLFCCLGGATRMSHYTPIAIHRGMCVANCWHGITPLPALPSTGHLMPVHRHVVHHATVRTLRHTVTRTRSASHR